MSALLKLVSVEWPQMVSSAGQQQQSEPCKEILSELVNTLSPLTIWSGQLLAAREQTSSAERYANRSNA